MVIATKIIPNISKPAVADIRKAIITKETVTASMEIVPSKIKNWDLDILETERDSAHLSNNTEFQDEPIGKFTYLLTIRFQLKQGKV